MYVVPNYPQCPTLYSPPIHLWGLKSMHLELSWILSFLPIIYIYLSIFHYVPPLGFLRTFDMLLLTYPWNKKSRKSFCCNLCEVKPLDCLHYQGTSWRGKINWFPSKARAELVPPRRYQLGLPPKARPPLLTPPTRVQKGGNQKLSPKPTGTPLLFISPKWSLGE